MYQITQMKKEDIGPAIQIWHKQFDAFCRNDSFPDFLNGGAGTIEIYLTEQIEKGDALIAKKGEDIAGYLAWMCVDFHSERTAFCPIVGHAAMQEDEIGIYHALYTVAAQRWVQGDRFNHLWMIFYDDQNLKDMLYDLGFGSYVIDACQRVSNAAFRTNCPFRITKAVPGDASAVFELQSELDRYMGDSPIFLKAREYTQSDIESFISRDTVFLAWDNKKLAGMMSLNVKQGYHFEKLTTPDSGYIGSPGVFVRPEYRGKGIGTGLLSEVFGCCAEAGKPFLHLSFETANPNANRFWPKYFKPAIRSVRRTINKDANSKLT